MGKKVYSLTKNPTKNEQAQKKMGLKGISTPYVSEISNKDWDSLLSKDPVVLNLKGDLVSNRSKMSKNYTTGTIELKPTTLSLSNLNLDKSRQRVFNLNHECIATLPLCVDNNKFIDREIYKKIYGDKKTFFNPAFLKDDEQKIFYKKNYFDIQN